MQATPQAEHAWLQKLVGQWTWEHESAAEPGGPPIKFMGTEMVRSLGGVWFVCEGRGTMPDGSPSTTIMSLGYDPAKGRFVGSFIGSMMCSLWVYDGALELDGRVLALHSEGPSFSGDGTTSKYRDNIEFVSDDHRLLTSDVRTAEGNWHRFMQANYRRMK